jgi:hypothetical protein
MIMIMMQMMMYLEEEKYGHIDVQAYDTLRSLPELHDPKRRHGHPQGGIPRVKRKQY